MQLLRQSTSVVVRVGPAVAVADGFTPVTNLTVSGADEAEALRAAGAATLDISGATFAAVTGADGWYDLTLDTTATNTVGTLDIVINDDSLILPIFARFQVVEEAVFDQLFAASALGAGSVSAVSDVKSQLVIVASDLLQVYSDSTIIASDLVQVYSDTTIIYSDTTVIEAGGGSLTATQASQLTRIQSDVIIVGSDLLQVYSDSTIIASDLVQVYSDTTLIVPSVSDIESSLVIVKSDLVVAISDIGDISAAASPDVLVDTTIATLATQTSFTLTAGSADDDVYNGMAAVFTDVSTATQKAVAFISDYVGSTRTVTLEAAPGFTIATTDSVAIMAAGASTSSPPAAALVGAQASALTRVQSDLIIVGSDLVQVYSDTTRIDSNTVLAETNISDIESSLVIIKSDLLQVYSDTTILVPGVSDIESSIVVMRSDQVVAEAMISDVESSLVIVKSDLVITTSDTTAIHSNTTIITAGVNVAQVNSVTIGGTGTEIDPFGPAA